MTSGPSICTAMHVPYTSISINSAPLHQCTIHPENVDCRYLTCNKRCLPCRPNTQWHTDRPHGRLCLTVCLWRLFSVPPPLPSNTKPQAKTKSTRMHTTGYSFIYRPWRLCFLYSTFSTKKRCIINNGENNKQTHKHNSRCVSTHAGNTVLYLQGIPLPGIS